MNAICGKFMSKIVMFRRFCHFSEVKSTISKNVLFLSNIISCEILKIGGEEELSNDNLFLISDVIHCIAD